ncbi:MAG: hypothetical protein QF733_01495 [Phycisphaerales bacterium]|jgi:hypothetical protein|nr:hypothetical protein [Phycisphaerales bacterium]
MFRSILALAVSAIIVGGCAGNQKAAPGCSGSCDAAACAATTADGKPACLDGLTVKCGGKTCTLKRSDDGSWGMLCDGKVCTTSKATVTEGGATIECCRKTLVIKKTANGCTVECDQGTCRPSISMTAQGCVIACNTPGSGGGCGGCKDGKKADGCGKTAAASKCSTPAAAAAAGCCKSKG